MLARQLFSWTFVWFGSCKITLQDLNVSKKPSASTLKARAQPFLEKDLGKELDQAPSYLRRRSVELVAHVPMNLISQGKDFKHIAQTTTLAGKPAKLDKGKAIMMDTSDLIEHEPNVFFSEEEDEFYQSDDIIELMKETYKDSEFRAEHLRFPDEQALLEHYGPIWKASGLEIDKMLRFSNLIGLGKRAPLTRKGIEAEWDELYKMKHWPISLGSLTVTREWDDYEDWFMNELGDGEKVLRDWVRYVVLKRDPTWDVWWTDEQLGNWLSLSDKTEWRRQLMEGDQKRYLSDEGSQSAAAEMHDRAPGIDLNTPGMKTEAPKIDTTHEIDTKGLTKVDNPNGFKFFTWRFQQKAEIFLTKGGYSKWWRRKLWKKLRPFQRKKKNYSRST
ncbi:uncharacterized protein MELLADRAFT_65815 [Melampsora larici-populina 98AG31]|uniref:Secreted protein n=1 Tax=Melampsora larici-populina (strain 98AG31 / pathotype 3-4-7) TaxID=747676 RepID=F4RWT4_MELLP|nr:uncharacterized protein MELLADRAFT_65815 [Melampsora larici-populina 98AG31]EGG03170.1 hypothetical protein MELLADRAFT_65815 [Melampsora larici-populina 98AG31]